MVYPILRVPPKNRFAMVVTAGPQGGGGLHIFGVLKGGKVYTIFLPMPQKNWILQYSMVNDPSRQKAPQRNGVTLQVDFGVVPPAVEKRFDFHRPSLTAEQKKKMIILHGFIGADGSVEHLRKVEVPARRPKRQAHSHRNPAGNSVELACSAQRPNGIRITGVNRSRLR
jgi:hypothetical protein